MNILLADDSQEVRSALRLALEQQAGNSICGEAPDAINLLAQVARHCPEVIILDTELPGLLPCRRPALRSLNELIETLRLVCPRVRIITLSSRPVPSQDARTVPADAQACKSDPPEALLAALAGFAPQPRQP